MKTPNNTNNNQPYQNLKFLDDVAFVISRISTFRISRNYNINVLPQLQFLQTLLLSLQSSSKKQREKELQNQSLLLSLFGQQHSSSSSSSSTTPSSPSLLSSTTITSASLLKKITNTISPTKQSSSSNSNITITTPITTTTTTNSSLLINNNQMDLKKLIHQMNKLLAVSLRLWSSSNEFTSLFIALIKFLFFLRKEDDIKEEFLVIHKEMRITIVKELLSRLRFSPDSNVISLLKELLNYLKINKIINHI